MHERLAAAAQTVLALSETKDLDPGLAANIRMDAAYIQALADTSQRGGQVPLRHATFALSLVPHWRTLLGAQG